MPAPIALAVLNASMTFVNVWPTPNIRWVFALSVELAAMVFLVALIGDRLPPRVSWILAGLWVVLVGLHYVDVTAPGLYGRDFNLYWDSPHLWNVASMLTDSIPAWRIVWVASGVLLALAGVFFLSTVAWRSILSMASTRHGRIATGTLALCVLAIFAWQSVQPPADGLEIPFGDPVTVVLWEQSRYVVSMLGPGAARPRLTASPRELSVPAVEGGRSDVMLMFIESYGAVTYDNGEFRKRLDPVRHDLVRAAAEAGRTVLSAFVTSPTFGGSSWLAHLSLLTGVEVRDPYAYATLMTQERPTLVTALRRSGFRTVGLMPGIRQDWPEGAFYGFDVIYGRDHMEYNGPQFGWWSIPDQYSLARFDALELQRPSRQPVFAVFPTSTTHAPFGPVPPYQPDWRRILTGNPFDAIDIERSFAFRPDLTNLGPSYIHATAYEFATLAGYVREHAGDAMIVIAIGDHQPPAAVSGKGASWDVPIHVIADRGPLVSYLLSLGFEEGVSPERPPVAALHELAPMLLRALRMGVTDSVLSGSANR